jgi:hypothetical protein
MANDDSGAGTALAAEYGRPPEASVYRVSPTLVGNRKNTIVARFPRPVACWRIHHAYFRFGSSLILPTIADELRKLKPLVTDSQGQPRSDRLSTIFAHADPVGDDDNNKVLSGRRARAFYALVTRNVDLWLKLFSPVNGDRWGLESTQVMLATVQQPTGTGPYYSGPIDGAAGPQTDRAVRQFQRDNGLVVDGTPGEKTRTKLYPLYMDAIASPGGQPLVLGAKNFLGDPNRDDGKAAYQGCSEFNPIRILSQQDQTQLTKAARNERNAPNRRVLVFVFRRDDFGPVDGPALAAKWPCPTWEGPASECRKQQWVDAQARLAPGDQERNYDHGEHTMSCAWYERFARFSPCERPQPEIGRAPVYFCTLAVPVSILSKPEASASVVGQLAEGSLVEVVAEKYDVDAFYVRIEQVDPQSATYYGAKGQPSGETWICVAKDGEQYACWSSVDADPLGPSSPAVDLDDRFAALSPEV